MRSQRTQRKFLRRELAFCRSGGFLALLLGSSLAGANWYRNNPDRSVDQRIESWTSPIGRLETVRRVNIGGVRGIFKGTGFLVSPCYILTAAHVVSPDGDALLDGKIDPDTDFRMSFRARDSKSHQLVTVVAGIASNLNTLKERYLNSPDFIADPTKRDLKDFLFLRLPDNDCLGASPGFGWFDAAEDDLANGSMAVALGYPQGRSKDDLRIGAGRIGDVTAAGLREFTGSYRVGESGGPVLVVDKDRLKVTGLIIGHEGSSFTQEYDAHSKQNTNEILSLSKILRHPAIKAVIDADKARFVKQNPAASRQMINGVPK